MRFPFARDLAGFDFSAQPSIDRAQVREIAGSRFIINSEAVLLLGPPGVGKTRICGQPEKGSQRAFVFRNASDSCRKRAAPSLTFSATSGRSCASKKHSKLHKMPIAFERGYPRYEIAPPVSGFAGPCLSAAASADDHSLDFAALMKA